MSGIGGSAGAVVVAGVVVVVVLDVVVVLVVVVELVVVELVDVVVVGSGGTEVLSLLAEDVQEAPTMARAIRRGGKPLPSRRAIRLLHLLRPDALLGWFPLLWP